MSEDEDRCLPKEIDGGREEIPPVAYEGDLRDGEDEECGAQH